MGSGIKGVSPGISGVGSGIIGAGSGIWVGCWDPGSHVQLLGLNFEHKAILTRLGGLKNNHIGSTMHDFFQRVTQECQSDRDDSSSESASPVIGDQLTYC